MAWVIDDAHTTVGFTARHMGLSRVRGVFRRFHGDVDLTPDDLTRTRGRVEIDAATIDTGDEQRDAHLRSADFLDVERFPTITFVPTRVVRIDDRRYEVRGDLAIRGVTNEVTLEYEHAGERRDPYGNRKLGGRLTGEIDRRDWDLTWNVVLEAGGLLVGDRIELDIDGQVAESAEVVAEEALREAKAS